MEGLDKNKIIRIFLGNGIYKGKKEITEKVLFNIIKELKKNREFNNKIAFEVIIKIIEEIRPILRLKRFRKGKNFHEIAVPLKEKRSYNVGANWLYKESYENFISLNYYEKLLLELNRVLVNENSKVLKKKEELYMDAVNNRINFEFIRVWRK